MGVEINGKKYGEEHEGFSCQNKSPYRGNEFIFFDFTKKSSYI